jgi:hypothetical protein
MGIYGNPQLRAWLAAEFKKAGKAFDAGKACIRFKQLSDLPLQAIGQIVARVTPDKLIEVHNRAQAQRPHKRPAKAPAKARPAARSTGNKAPAGRH